jgi:hypothetical protein
MALTINTFSPNTKVESAKVNTNFTNVKTEVDDLRDEKTLSTLTDNAGGTVSINLNTSHVFTLTMTGTSNTRTLQLLNATTNEAFVIRLVQGSSPGTGNLITWFTTIKWPSGVAPTLSTGANKVDSFGFICTATNTYDGYFLGFNLS